MSRIVCGYIVNAHLWINSDVNAFVVLVYHFQPGHCQMLFDFFLFISMQICIQYICTIMVNVRTYIIKYFNHSIK